MATKRTRKPLSPLATFGTATNVMERFGISANTFAVWKSKGVPGFIFPGMKAVRYNFRDVENWLRENSK